MRVAIIGQSGQVAQALLNAQLPDAQWEMRAFGRPDFDLTDFEPLRAGLVAFAPDVIVNAAAYTGVDKAESETDAAYALNRDGPGKLAEIAETLGIPLVHISTDYVFDGSASAPYREADATAPMGIYGASKLAGEQAVAAASSKHIILRTAWVHSPWGANFVKTMLRLGQERDALNVVDDQIGSPSYAPDLAEAIVGIIPVLVKADGTSDIWGVYHLTNAGVTSWHGFARQIFEVAREAGAKTPQLGAITTAQYPTPAQRPAYSVLDNSKFENTFGHKMRDWQAGADDCVRELLRAN